MAYDEALARRVRRLLATLPDFSERRMFGGLCFMLAGRMCCGIVGQDLVVRTGREAWGAALREPHARPMDFTGRPMRGFVYVAPAGLRGEPALREWVGRALAFVSRSPRGPRRPVARGRAGKARRRDR